MKRLRHSRPSPALSSAVAAITFTSMTFAPIWQAAAQAPQAAGSHARTPIDHVILIIGENRTFDHVFATYTPKPGQTVNNLLSEGIVKADGTPGPNYSKAAQNQASDTTTYQLSPPSQTPYATLPPALTDGAPSTANDESPPPFATRPASFQILLLTRLSGAPVSKMRRYGPLPLILTLMTMCCVLINSNGTTIFFAVSFSPVS